MSHAPIPSEAEAETARPIPRERPRVTRRLALICTGAALAVGMLLGAAANGESGVLRRDLAAVQDRLVTAEELVAASEERTAQLGRTHDAELVALTERHEDEVEAVEETARASAADASSELEEAQALIAEQKRTIESHQERISDLESTPSNVVEPQAEYVGSVSFGNCSEARAAGAAPVYSGDPGYGRHLDRDGDGVGCE
ncbi:excalibur calcium-binding domain-containing protein [Mycetocola reblochoni]|uniref:Excalibur calcium-binding domain-containing protein n=1 Tax=Mycetocola reblochoni REB411 TaxID=1255698 RepID=A0A1R4IJU0_9MICO|nr:excalibur calcium-binding domain-containing protein [Mycetocola reblochoni]SJN19633.1 hypothetical protein FM119_02000 [Mycetocola reblochoni REB411]